MLKIRSQVMLKPHMLILPVRSVWSPDFEQNQLEYVPVQDPETGMESARKARAQKRKLRRSPIVVPISFAFRCPWRARKARKAWNQDHSWTRESGMHIYNTTQGYRKIQAHPKS